MKKSVFLTKSTVVLLALSLMLVMFTGCGKSTKKAVTTDDFKTLASEKGLTCVDALEQFAAYDNFNEVTIAVPSDLSYQIEFYVLVDESNARSFFDTGKINFGMYKDDGDAEISNSGGNYGIYSLNANGRYMYVEYVGNTVLYVNTDEANQSTVDAFIKELKY